MKIELGKTYKLRGNDTKLKVTTAFRALCPRSGADRIFFNGTIFSRGSTFQSKAWRWDEDGIYTTYGIHNPSCDLVELIADPDNGLCKAHVANDVSLKTTFCKLCEQPIYFDTNGDTWTWMVDERRLPKTPSGS